ncbi:hypothetical protein [Streptomyces aurantiogriseus]|uniref:Uncharacterized protein n=1 Tax=Streptomyces aurantiogriseus TaxID=66870 RepID=A0A918C4F8_9ACTN|nr:hypothetical protein [Streptomyces aurantiogriseus]GGR06694.1 hypothetical protein GCM10010251_23080 [Streptomyces aurantiogriseus]
MDQPTRERILHTEAAKYGIAPDVIDRAVGVIAAVQRRDRADFRRNFGGDLTPDRWLAAHGVSGFEELCAHAARTAGLGDDGDLIMRIVSAIAPPPEQRADDRPVQFWARPLTNPEEAAFPAYRVSYEDARVDISPGFDWSGALLRRALHEATARARGAASLEEATGVVVFTDGDLSGAYVARPAPGHIQPACARCGQWEREHTLHERFGSCQEFTAPTTRLAAVPVP